MADPAPNTLGLEALERGGDSGVCITPVDPHGDTAAHDHVFHEIVVLESGTAEHDSAAGTEVLRPGDVIVIRPGVWHQYRHSRRVRLYNVLFEARALRPFRHLIATLPGAFELFWRRPRRDEGPAILHASAAELPPMLETLRTLQAEQTHRSPGWRAAVHARLLDLLIAVARINLDTEREPRPPLGDRVGRAVLDAVSHIEQHFEQPVALDDLARRVHLSPGYLSRCFSERMGMGVVEFMHTLRAEEACRLLRWSGLPVGRIAERVGYRDVAYFSRCFSRRIGESPTRYRERWTTLGTD